MIGSLVLMGVALVLYALAIVPNLDSSATREGQKPFLLFYGDIAKVEIEEFRESLFKGCERDFLDELISETHCNARICHMKMKLYGAAVRLSLMSILLALGSWAAHVMMFR